MNATCCACWVDLFNFKERKNKFYTILKTKKCQCLNLEQVNFPMTLVECLLREIMQLSIRVSVCVCSHSWPLPIRESCLCIYSCGAHGGWWHQMVSISKATVPFQINTRKDVEPFYWKSAYDPIKTQWVSTETNSSSFPYYGISGYQNTIATNKNTLFCGLCMHQIIFFSNL